MSTKDKNKICQYCDKSFFSLQRRKTHEEICSVKEFRDKIIDQKNEEIQLLKTDHENKIKQYENQINELKSTNSSLQSQINKLTQQYIDFSSNVAKNYTKVENQISNSNNTNSNNTIGNINNTNITINTLQPLDISMERFDQIVNEKYNYDLYRRIKESCKMLILDFLSDDYGKLQVVICDSSRGKFKVLDKSTNSLKRISINYIHDYIKRSNALTVKLKEFNQHFLVNEKELPQKEIEDEINHRIKLFSNPKFFKVNVYSDIEVAITKGINTTFKPSIRQAELISNSTQSDSSSDSDDSDDSYS
jgi:hypothetical protein